MRAGAATAKRTARTARTSSTAPSSCPGRSSRRPRWAAWCAGCCWSSPWAAPVNCTRSGPGSTGKRCCAKIQRILMERKKNKWRGLESECPYVRSSRSMFAPISRHEAQLIQQQAPPSYGQLIAQGVIPPVEDFPTENPNEVRRHFWARSSQTDGHSRPGRSSFGICHWSSFLFPLDDYLSKKRSLV